MLKLKRYHSIENPVKPQDGIDDHCSVVHPHFLVAQRLSEEGMFGGWVAETPVIVDVPEARIDGVNCCKGNEEGAVRGRLLDAIDAKGHVEDDGCQILPEIE